MCWNGSRKNLSLAFQLVEKIQFLWESMQRLRERGGGRELTERKEKKKKEQQTRRAERFTTRTRHEFA